MTRCETIGDAKLYLGDCEELLFRADEDPVDAIVTDPPYGLGDKWQGGGGTARTSWAFDPSEAREWDRTTHPIVSRLVYAAPEVVIWGGNYYPLPPSRCWLLWDKKQNDEWTTGQAEMAWTSLDRPVRMFRFAQCEQASEGPKLHPTQKPLALMAWCLKWIKGAVIQDPFMGSGTTGVAAIQMGRKFIGIEREPKYFDIACRRIEQAYKQRPLFEAEPQKKPEQMGIEL
jgi:site-specific DNA-methyltransferase (adenine-specific)